MTFVAFIRALGSGRVLLKLCIVGLLLSFGFLVTTQNAVAQNAPIMSLVSQNSSGSAANNYSSNPVMSSDGFAVVFASQATNLCPNDCNRYAAPTSNYSLIFKRDRIGGTTSLVDLGSDGVSTDNSMSWAPSVSTNGRYVAFCSSGTNLVSSPSYNTSQLFVRDTQANTTTLASINASGTPENGECDSGGGLSLDRTSISADGTIVVWVSTSTNLTSAGNSGGFYQVFARNLSTRTTTLVSAVSPNTPANGDSMNASISADGGSIVFDSKATNFQTVDPNPSKRDVWEATLSTGALTLVSQDKNHQQGLGPSFLPSVSAHGQYVAFESGATNFGSATQVVNEDYVRDINGNTLTQVSIINGAPATTAGEYPSITADLNASDGTDGQLVAFESGGQVYLRDITGVHSTPPGTPTTTLISQNNGVQGNDASINYTAVDPLGRFVAFSSWATNLVTPSTPSGVLESYLQDSGEKTKPSVGVPTASPNPFKSSNPTTIQATISEDSPGTTWTMTITDPVTGLTDRTLTGPAISGLTGAAQATWDGTNSTGATLPDGNYSVTVTATDSWGNTATSAPGTVTLRNGGPTLGQLTANPQIFSPYGVHPTSTISTNVQDPSAPITWTITISNSSGFSRSYTGSSASTSAFTAAAVWDGKDTTDTTVQPSGVYTTTITAIDGLGNSSSTTGTVQLDTIAPTISNPTSSQSRISSQSGGSPNSTTYAATISKLGTWWLSFNSPLTGTWTCPTQSISSTTLASTQLWNAHYYCSSSAQVVPDGTYTATIWAQDIAGNQTHVAALPNIVVDGTAPSLSNFAVSNAMFSPAVNNATVTSTVFTATLTDAWTPISWTIHILDSTGATVRSFSGTGNVNQCWDGSSDTATSQCTDNTHNAGVQDGSYSVKITASDGGNNVGSILESNVVTVDGTSPTIEMAAPTNGGNTVYANQPLVVYVNDLGAGLSPAGSGLSTNTAAITVTDPAGGEAPQSPSFTISNGVLRTAGLTLTPGKQYSTAITIKDAVGNLASFSGQFSVVSQPVGPSAGSALVTAVSTPASGMQPGGTTSITDTYGWDSVQISVQPFDVQVSTQHAGNGGLLLTLPLAGSNLVANYTIHGIPQTAAINETSATLSVGFGTNAAGGTIHVGGATGNGAGGYIQGITANVPKLADAGSVTLSGTSLPSSFDFGVCADPTQTGAQSCSPDPVPGNAGSSGVPLPICDPTQMVDQSPDSASSQDGSVCWDPGVPNLDWLTYQTPSDSQQADAQNCESTTSPYEVRVYGQKCITHDGIAGRVTVGNPSVPTSACHTTYLDLYQQGFTSRVPEDPTQAQADSQHFFFVEDGAYKYSGMKNASGNATSTPVIESRYHTVANATKFSGKLWNGVTKVGSAYVVRVRYDPNTASNWVAEIFRQQSNGQRVWMQFDTAPMPFTHAKTPRAGMYLRMDCTHQNVTFSTNPIVGCNCGYWDQTRLNMNNGNWDHRWDTSNYPLVSSRGPTNQQTQRKCENPTDSNNTSYCYKATWNNSWYNFTISGE